MTEAAWPAGTACIFAICFCILSSLSYPRLIAITTDDTIAATVHPYHFSHEQHSLHSTRTTIIAITELRVH